MPASQVAIVGGGFSGAMLAVALAKRGVGSTIINRTRDIGLGVAYSTPFEGHLLNVRSARMSAVEGAPADFTGWLAERHPGCADPDGFAPRKLFGLYVQDRLAEAEAACPGLIDRCVGHAVAVEEGGVRLADGGVIEADAVVLATGNPAPRTVGADEADGPVIHDPWAAGALDRIGPDDAIVLIGTGLTMVDMLLMLEGRGWRGRAIAASRRGLLPRPHGEHPDAPVAPTAEMSHGPLSSRVRAARRLAATKGWRGVMEGLRPITAELWAETDLRSRRAFARRLRPWWDVHRHRLAPNLAAEIDRLRAEGRLTVHAGHIRDVSAGAEGVQVSIAPRGDAGTLSLSGRWLIDCTGPGHDPMADRLTRSLIDQGRARLDPLSLGLDLDASGRVLDAEGRADLLLFVLGPPARAAFWETIAAPDIRKRIEDVADALAAV